MTITARYRNSVSEICYERKEANCICILGSYKAFYLLSLCCSKDICVLVITDWLPRQRITSI